MTDLATTRDSQQRAGCIAPVQITPSVRNGSGAGGGVGGVELFDIPVNPSDVVLTNDRLAAQIIAHFKPSGRVLDPCRGTGAFWKQMPGAEWCEVREGRDFFGWGESVDWIVSNPPYSIFLDWLRHSMTIAPEIVYLIPLFKVWQSEKVMNTVREWGGIAETAIVGSGRKIGFPTGFSIGAVHFRRGYRGDMRVTWLSAAGRAAGAGVGLLTDDGRTRHGANAPVSDGAPKTL